MSNYFPYSQIIASIRNSIQQSVSRSAYFGDWSVCDCEQPEVQSQAAASISELYY
ncbi:MAG: hypothetical protein K2N19_04465 [Muribaculaceae bacterium]|nr:hypothetical protein [Muribaculaceae bacterium]